MSGRQVIWYREPAVAWEEALPLGNGRMGAMVYGGAGEERIALNEDSLWSGVPRDTDPADGAEDFRHAQRLAAQGELRAAQEWIEDRLLGPFTQGYLPLGELQLGFGGLDGVSGYRRELSLADGVCITRFQAGGACHTREALVSHPDQVLAVRLTADAPGALSFEAAIACPLRHRAWTQEQMLLLEGECPVQALPNYVASEHPVVYEPGKGVRFFCALGVESDGCVSTSAQGLVVCQATQATLYLAVRTSFTGPETPPCASGHPLRCLADLEAARGRGWQAVLNRHLADHRALFGRAGLELGPDRYPEQSTGERLRRFSSQQDDQTLCALLFHYGRYLAIACSRPGTQAANLQGIWNREMRPPWSSNYTLNINTQMNYWPVEAAGLPELHQPLFELIQGLRRTGARTARRLYGARGAVSHHNTDLWRQSSPVGAGGRGSAGYAFWPMSLGWLCRHLMEHYRYGLDRGFLREQALPALRDVVRFYLDVLVEDGHGCLTLSPATSPENAFVFQGAPQSVSRSAAMTGAILREALASYLEALEVLGLEEPMALEARAALARVAPYRVGAQGQILEWEEAYEEVEPHHRHLSHLYGLYPGREIDLRRTPELARACRRSLELRGDEGTGWSLGWKVNLWARLGEGDRALSLLKRQLRCVEAGQMLNYRGGGGSYLNLFDAHPPFQIDGNFGACAGICEMLIQCEEGTVWLLPALPGEWREGNAFGLRAHGGLTVSLRWREGQLTRAELVQSVSGAPPVAVRWRERSWRVDLAQGEHMELLP